MAIKSDNSHYSKGRTGGAIYFFWDGILDLAIVLG